jgi:transglutaminase superfamily protein
MKKFFVAIIILTAFSCSNQVHFINDKEYRETVISDFEKVKELASNRETQLFDVFNQNIILEEQEALMFLYAYMPLNDLADYNGEFFLNNVQLAFKTRETFNWGNQIPEDIFRHFVLPYRVNNENLDSSRTVFFDELSERLQVMELKEAILEVNHWCHEKVNYKSTDERTISPLNAIKSTYGRCGEESTFTVTAMRAAGIPARQCYTPRWAHTDDNHAWVEVWLDGNWRYLGACEPEPDLDIAWFSAPALRAMLVNSNVFGKYTGPEEIIRKEEKYTKVNMLSNYAPVKTVYAKIIDENNEIVNDATVEFQLYNYAEFYPIAKKQVDKNGVSSLLTGFGDLIIWAYKDNNYAYQKITIEKTDTILLKLHSQEGENYTDIFDIVPPIAKDPKAVSAEGKIENKKRLAQEDSIREAYAGTFMKQGEAIELAQKYNFEPEIVWNFIDKSQGNYPEIAQFIEQAASINADYTIPILKSIAPKDLRDSEAKILLSHINHSFVYAGDLPKVNNDLFIKYVLNPRIANEKIIAYKAFLQNAFGVEFITKTKRDINHLTEWIQNEITILKDENFYRVPLTSKGVYEIKLADEYSRDLFFVATCRSFGIPSRLEPATKTPQYFKEEWIDVSFNKTESSEAKKTGILKLINSPENATDLKYRVHFALSKFENGKYHTLDYGWDTPISEIDENLELEEGNYLLLTGNRQNGGSTLTSMEFINLKSGEEKEIIIKLRTNNEELKVLAEFIFPNKLSDLSGNEIKINADAINIIGFLDPEKEPTKHSLVDIEKIASSFDKTESNIYLISSSTEINEAKYKLPIKAKYLFDNNFGILKQLSEELNQELTDLPVFIVMKDNKIYFLSEGYTIGIGEQMIKVIQKL